MLDVRISAYIVPVAEQPQASLTPVIAVDNVADENAVITGVIRIYRESTGLLIYTSKLAVTQLEHHSSANIAALTPFDPPAPADQDYFIKADIIATSYLPGPPIAASLGAWYFDIKTPAMGPAPAGHHVTHENGGSDEVDCTGLVGTGSGAHAATHEDGGADELEVADLATAEMDDALVLAPDGAGGVEFRAEAGGGAHHATHETGGGDEVNHDAVQFAKLHPAADSTTAVRVLKADNTTAVLTVDTTNSRVGIGMTPGAQKLEVDGNVAMSANGTGISTIGTQLQLQETGDTFGSMRLALQNRVGVNGAIFENTSAFGAAGLIDFVFKPWYNSANYQTNIRIEGRSGSELLQVGEMALGTPGAATLVIGPTQSAFRVGSLGIGTTIPAISDGNGIHITGKILRIGTTKTPATAGAAGNAGEICWDADFIYVCVATNTWKKVAIATW
jgi:hypothetical protein